MEAEPPGGAGPGTPDTPLAAELAASRESEARLVAELTAVRATKTFRYTHQARRLYGRLRAAAGSPPPAPDVVAAAPAPTAPDGADGAQPMHPEPKRGPILRWEAPDDEYRAWVARHDTLDDAARARIAARVAALVEPPSFSVVMPVCDPDPVFLEAALASVRAQLYPHRELCIADDASDDDAVVSMLDAVAASDDRVHLVRRTERGHISAASNSACEMASGDWLAFVDHDDVLPEHALAMVALALGEHPAAKLVYTDEDKLDAESRRCKAYFKPDFDRILLLSQNYPAHLRCVRRDVFEEVGGLRAGFEGSQDWDLHLRLAERLGDDEVLHVPRVLYHWRIHAGSAAATIGAKPYAATAAARAVEEHVARQTRGATVVPRPDGWCRVEWARPEPAPSVSIVICTRDGVHLSRCLDSIWSRTSYPDFEVVVVDNGSVRPGTADVLRAARQRGTVVRRDERDFNFSALNNAAVKESTSEHVCFLNDDIELVHHDWLDEMVRQVVQPGVAAVGAKLCYPDGVVQHAGVVLVADGVAAHAHNGIDRLDDGFFGRAGVVGQFSAVTAAAMLVRRDAFDEVGGFDDVELAVAFNDVDLCLRLRAAGWRVVWTPFAEMVHHESATRGTDEPGSSRFAGEVACMRRRWGDLLRRDPFHNPNLDLRDGNTFALAEPPRLPPL